MDIVINEELQAYIEPLTAEEDEALERSLLAEGCRDALVLWGQVLVDGHNRYRLCRKHGIPFQAVQNPRLQSLEDVQLWMIDQHLGRRSLSNFQRGVLALRKSELVAQRRGRPGGAPAEGGPAAATDGDPPWAQDGDSVPAAPRPVPAAQALDSREAIAKAARLSSSQVQMIEKIHKQAAPEVVAAVRAGSLSINAAAAVASMPVEEQAAAAAAGADELKQAARRVREARRKPAAADAAATEGPQGIDALRQRVAELTAENEDLRRQLAALQATA